MRTVPFWLLFALVLAPAAAQDDDDGESIIEISDPDDLPPPESPQGPTAPQAPGTPGGPKGDEGDRGAPKLARPLQERVNEAIERGVEWLKKQQAPDGSWGPCRANRKYDTGERGDFVCYESGPTSFAVYTLSKCDVPKRDRSVRMGHKWLHDNYRKFLANIGNNSVDSLVTYECSSIVLMLEAMHERSDKLQGRIRSRRLETNNPFSPPDRSRFDKDDWRWMHELIVYLTEGVTGRRTVRGAQNPGGGWRYGQANGDQDVSATQFVLLGLRAASDAGYPVKPKVWLDALSFLRSVQASTGGFPYKGGMGTNNGMTAAGVASAIICKEQLELLKEPVPAWVDPMIERGMAHLDEVFDVQHNKGPHDGGAYHYYYLYSVERVGDLTGRREFAGKDWYVRGAEFLLDNQAGDGSWTDSTCMRPSDVLGTCFALLFLKRATIPAVTLSGD